MQEWLNCSNPAGRFRFGFAAGPARADMEKISAALLLAFTVLALLWANLPFGATYGEFWDTAVDLRVGGLDLEMTLHDIVNDALMAFFFFTVGLEVKREFAVGELTDRSRAVVPVAAALAGLLVPAGIFLALNPSGENATVWGAVISTDTAFLVGALAVVGPRFPGRLRVFLLTLAVVDDIGALAAIAVFYTSGLELLPLLTAVVLLVLVALVRFLPTGRGPAYTVLSLLTWAATYASGVHATLAGVAIALMIPVFPPRRPQVERTEELARAFRQSPTPEYAAATARSLKESISINERLQGTYAPYVSFLILPLFALANAGVLLDGATLAAAWQSRLTWGIIIALVVGKTLGITAATALLRRTGAGQLAPGLTLARVGGGAALCGIGFTISLFIVDLAVEDERLQAEARVGVLSASVLAFLLAWAWFRLVDRLQPASTVGRFLVRGFDPARDHFRGNPDAPLQLVEYGDFECPFCSRATGSIDEVLEHFGPRLVYVWRHLPLTRVHPHAVEAARASEAADRQGSFREYGRLLFRRQDQLEPDDLITYALELGLDGELFRRDLQSGPAANRVEDDALDAEFMDLHSTPTFFIGSVRHYGPYDAPSLIRALEGSAAQ
ncbi:Na+/H+ antiporter NhaA [Arthrobacter sp. zg-Y820]|uniref:Na+/H+ antiporter NhaA n=1 Tax=unclassified Arthrobacter TaxID=235627 RepID=UPI001E42F064|nr:MULTISPECIES: Na+/H+ antiporter NhaA [unclassified Arthrobacter]MCC9196339.1 Na+/H+ antiporter NhaA [Arthrobacter sp. zg-Y820]MDK1279200.1 Na+/H+ antiporter NhaA [Arthrobacter sp. zg.Y820]WIB08401.1 Na+/H+ antiporter NhaA [Arthrobacter sp. zg-Y820]